ncbi:MAG: TolC family protein [Verrucomicrobia bacterium]|nr:TolC family protein [Verrucomicrobiota bacterium]
MNQKTQWMVGILVFGVLLTGCTGVPTQSEKTARADVAVVSARLGAGTVDEEQLTVESGLGDYLRYGMLHQPGVRQAYYDWIVSVERITGVRSLPDPRLTFRADVGSLVMVLIPGLMQDLPGPGKLGLRADVASEESASKYFQFASAVLRAAFEVKQAYYRLYFLEDKIGIHRENLALLSELEQLALTRNAVGKVTLQDVLRAQIEWEGLNTAIENLEDSRGLLVAQFKAALGIGAGQPDPPIPGRFESTVLDLDSEALFATALRMNPQLKAAEAEVRMAQAGISLARRARVPDFFLGLKADLKQSPTVWMPEAGMTLPIWRDKIAAELAAAQGRKGAAEARLSGEEIDLAVSFADRMFSYRESMRNLVLLQERLVPKARQSVEVARAGYMAGQIDFFNLIDADRTLLQFQLSTVDARIQRELMLADLSLRILSVPPPGAPLLSAPGQ